LLADLRQRGYTPGAWISLLSASWSRAQDTARCEAPLVQAWRRLSLAVLAGSAVPVTLAWRHHGPRHARRMAAVLGAGLVWQQADAYVHLGLNRRLHDGVLLCDFGPALWLSYLRGTVGHWLLATTVAGLDEPVLASGAMVVGAATDALDGALARRQRRATKLGAYADGEADVVLAVALTLAAVRRGSLPVRAYWLLAARYALPIGAAFGVAFRHARTPRLAHTLSGQLCGVAQATLLGCALAPRRWQRLADGPRRLLLPLTAALDVASSVSQVLRVLKPPTGGYLTNASLEVVQ
jgi:phosphatidylglycerophosphate synthase